MQSTTSETPLGPDQVLTPVELQRLTAWKWRYTLEAIGFTACQARELTLLKWLRVNGRC